MVLEMIFAIVMGGSVAHWIAKHTTKLSLSKITFWTPISFVKPPSYLSIYAHTTETNKERENPPGVNPVLEL